jgi:hypothetical protein
VALRENLLPNRRKLNKSKAIGKNHQMTQEKYFNINTIKN